jgi:bifunctional non-homologous end joining protein LigD
MATAKLAKYQAKRDFSVTSEPSGKERAAHAGLAYVIQKHDATRLHYDFRLELDGVLLSWAVPKGPSVSPKDRRLAVRTEDHPLAYGGFEGVIPKGQYGGGTVEIWDRGTWTPEGGIEGARAGMQAGKLAFEIQGEKLHGRWHLVRTKPQGKQESWLLFKGRDVAEVADLVARLPVGFKFTNLDRVIYPDQGITKAQLIAYLAAVSEWMLPYVAGRPLATLRCPDGATEKCFMQRHVPKGAPAAMKTIEDAIMVEDVAGLAALAQMGTVEIHTWGCRADDIERPDLCVFDLDPDEALPWDHVALGAFEVRKRLKAAGLESFVKTTGGKGLHVVVPFTRGPSWDELKAWAKAFAEQLAADQPDAFVANMGKAHRNGKIFVDYLRNGRAQMFVAPYSPRARSGAPVATPIAWEELAAGVDPKAFDVITVPRRLATVADPWAKLGKTKQAIGEHRRSRGRVRR